MPSQDLIDRIVESHQRKVPVMVVPLANELGIRVRRTHKWNDNICGAIVNQNGWYTIWTNAKHHLNRRRFTVAHELAHYILHRDLIGDGVYDDAMFRSGLSGKVEREANRYAANLLMPWPLIRKCMKEGLNSVEDLAARFRVSRTAMSIQLGFPWE